MKVLVTGSAGHLGEVLVRHLRGLNYEVVGVDIIQSDTTTAIGSIKDSVFIKKHMENVSCVFHTATLHKPHIVSHTKQDFVDVNVSGTLNLLEEAKCAGVDRFIFTSSTSVFGDALVPPIGSPAAWITEETPSVPKNIYGVTKAAAEDICELFSRNHELPCTILRVSRFFLEDDDEGEKQASYSGDNCKAVEFTHRRVDIEDVVSAHMLAMLVNPHPGFRKYIISATTPFLPEDLAAIREDAEAVLHRREPLFRDLFHTFGWNMFPSIDRVYVNTKARKELGWTPKYSFNSILEKMKVCSSDVSAFNGVHSEGALAVGIKGYHNHN